jgi:hypothetical protein
MSARLLLTTTVVAAGVLAPAATSGAAKKAPSYPTVKSISPMRAQIGGTMTITGKNFIKGKAKNTVVFRRSGRKVVFAKADGLSSKKLRLTVPAKLRTSLGKKQGAFVATKFQIRVLARRFGKTYTALKKSPTIAPDTAVPAPATPEEQKKAAAAAQAAAAAAAAAAAPAAAGAPAPPPDCDRDGTPDASDTDDDNDLLADTTEAAIGTLTCVADTDNDGIEDGWEYSSALDLNQASCPQLPGGADYPQPCAPAMPYPGKRAYPNPRDGEDAHADYDGDWMTAHEEFTAWKKKAAASAPHRTLTDMWYSDGKQSSVDNGVTGDGCRGMTVPDPFDGTMVRPQFRRADGTYPTLYEVDGVTVKAEYEVYFLTRDASDACLDDGQRDEDGDFLTNYEEAHNVLSSPQWWNGVTSEPLFQIAYAGTHWLDGDSDGDGVVDGLDDQDFDDFLNVEEIERGVWVRSDKDKHTNVNTGLWVHPFNPCLPSVLSRTCPTARPVGKPDAWRPFFKDIESLVAPRWPLYGTSYVIDAYDPDPTWVDPTPANPDDNQAPDITPDEEWVPPAGVDQTQLPVLHPLPR